MIYTVTMNAKSKQVRKHGSTSSNKYEGGGHPASKRPRVCSSSVQPSYAQNKLQRAGSGYDSGFNTTSSQSLRDDLFFDDDFTGEELAEIDFYASQAEKACEQDKAGIGEATPNIATSLKGFNFRQPESIKPIGKSNGKSSESSLKDLNHLQQQCADYKLKVEELQRKINQKDGETFLLRDKLVSVEKNLFEKKQQKNKDAEKVKEEKSQKEMHLENQVERIRDQKEFVQAELKEAQSLIENLKLRNQQLLNEGNAIRSVKTEMTVGKTDKTKSSQMSETPKKIRFVKPESPKVTYKKARLTNASVPHIKSAFDNLPQSASKSFHQESNPSIAAKRLACKIEAQKLTSGSTRYKSIKNFTPFCSLAESCSRVHSENINQALADTYANCAEGIEHMLAASDDGKRAAFSLGVLDCLDFFLQSISSKGLNEDKETLKVPSFLNVLQALLQILKMNCSHRETTTKCFKMVNCIFHHLATEKLSDDTVITAYQALTILAEKASNESITKLFPTFPVVCCHLHNKSTRSVVTDFLVLLASHKTGAQFLIDETPDNEDTIFSRLCSVATCESAKKESSVRFLSKVVSFLSVFIARHGTLVRASACFGDLYKTTNVILYHQLVDWKKQAGKRPDRETLISQGLCLLHSCSNLFVDGIPGIHRNHEHQLVLFMLRRFLGALETDSFWSSELRKILDSEIDSD